MKDLSTTEIESILKNLGGATTSTAKVSRESDQPLTASKIRYSNFGQGTQTNKEPLFSASTVPVHIEVILGKTKISLEKLLQLKEESVIPLDKLAGESVDIEANGVLIAKGEVVVVGEQFGVRITERVSLQS